jgi:YbbR domain-containing protein
MYSPFRHIGLKVVAVALAALLWLIVAGDHLVERSMRVPLEFRNIPNELEIVGDPPTTVDVRLRGSSAQLARLEPTEVVAVLDLTGARPGSRMFHLRNDEVRAPYGVDVSQVVPARSRSISKSPAGARSASNRCSTVNPRPGSSSAR